MRGKRSRHQQPALDDPASWVRYRKKLCASCVGSCCSLEVEVRAADLERMGLLPPQDFRDSLKHEAKRLKRERLIDRFHERSGIFTLARLANGDCIYLDQRSRRCTIYEHRPDTCRNHPTVGPRSGYCAYREKSA